MKTTLKITGDNVQSYEKILRERFEGKASGVIITDVNNNLSFDVYDELGHNWFFTLSNEGKIISKNS